MKGIYAASISIVNSDLTLNTNSTRLYAENLILKRGCHGVVLLGSTGQAQLISVNEKMLLIEQLSESSLKNHFIIGIGCNSFIETVNLMSYGQKFGFNRFLLMPPAYYKYDDDGVYSYFSKIVDRSPDAKIILYNFQRLSGYAFSIKIIEKLVKNFPNQIIGVKDSTYNLYDKLDIDNFFVFPGSERKLLNGLNFGCDGVISAVCNVTSLLARKVYDDFHSKKEISENKKLCNVREVFENYNLVSALHTYKSLENNIFSNILPPLQLLNDKQKKELLLNLKNLNFSSEKIVVA